MNMRGLVFDDPHGTEGLFLPTIEFAVVDLEKNESHIDIIVLP